jgi:ribosomal protein L11 methyltransferase
MVAPLWQTRFWVPAEAVGAFLEVLDAASVSAFEDPRKPERWGLALIQHGEPDLADLRARLAPLVERWRFALELELTPVPATDWLSHTAKNFPPQRIGRFWIHGSHVTEPAPPGSVPIQIDAGQAFGSGEHDSTRGCLLAIDMLARRRRPRRVLDLGCGAGILAIAAAKTFHARVIAADNDPVAVDVARENAARNGVAVRVRCRLSDGYGALRRAGPFDLILANILADPLCAMAHDTARNLAPRGTVVLSGLLDRQAERVTAAHRRFGLRLRQTIGEGPWVTLVMEARRLR